jgi:hypothetical protein
VQREVELIRTVGIGLGLSGLLLFAVLELGASQNPVSLTASAAGTPQCPASWELSVLPDLGSADHTFGDILALSADDVWAVGYESENTPSRQPVLLHWDGNAWNVADTPDVPLPAIIIALAATSTSDVWGVGYSGVQTLILHWDGQVWSRVDSPNPGTAGALLSVYAASVSDAWAVGFAGGMVGSMVLHWDGVEWTIAETAPGPPARYPLSVSGTGPNDVWLAGFSDIVVPGDIQLIEHWDGSDWQISRGTDPNPLSIGTLTSIVAISPNDAWASSTNQAYGRVLHWDGTEWAIPATGQHLGDFAALASTDIWAASPDGTQHWDGRSWTAGHSGNLVFSSIASSAVGLSYDVWGVTSPMIYHRCVRGPLAGDVGCDGHLNTFDALGIVGLLGGIDGSADCPGVADTDCDGSLTALDLLPVLKFSAGLITRPSCSPFG